MTRTEARKIARQMDKTGDFNFIRLIEDFDTGEVTIDAMNRAFMKRTVTKQSDWDDLKRLEGT